MPKTKDETAPPVRQAGTERPAAEALPEEQLDAVRGGAPVPFHRVINNTIYGATVSTEGTSEKTAELKPGK